MPKKKKIEEQAVEEIMEESGLTAAGPDPPVTPDEQTEPAAPPTTAVEPRQSTRVYDENILTLNDEERGFTAQESEELKWSYLVSAYYRRHILSGVVSGVEALKTNAPLCIVDYEGVRVAIPGHEMFMDDWPANQVTPVEFQSRLNDMLGATVEFMLRGVDIKNRVAGGSRRDAMKVRQQMYYASGRVKEGILIACRVIRASGKFLTVEALGVDTMIQASDASWKWFNDISKLRNPGDLVVARVMALETDPETGEPKLRLSIKAADNENPDRAALQKLTIGSVYFGVVTGVVDRLIFIRLQSGVNAKTMSYRSEEMPSKNDTVSFLVKSVDLDQCMAFGTVTRIIKRFGRFR